MLAAMSTRFVLALLFFSGCKQTVAPAPVPRVALRAQAHAAYEQKRYADCARLFSDANSVEASTEAGDVYDAACCQALVGEKDNAFSSLQRASALGFKDVKHLQKDPDLEALHGDPRWTELVARVSAIEAEYAKSINAELHELYQQDQAERSGDSAKLNWAEVRPRDAKRRSRVQEILDAGGATVAADYFHAAMVFQHGEDIADYQRAHQLALKASQLDPKHRQARWLAAASKDRELMHLGVPQLYGTQFRGQNGRWVLYEVDPTITDEERARWNVPSLEEAKKRAEAMNAPAK